MILLNDFKRQWADVREQATAVFEEFGAGGWYILGREVAEFEKSLAAFWGREFCVGVASGLDALELSLRAVGCGPGDRVLTTPVSAFATTLAILKIGAIPVFADVDCHGLINLDAWEPGIRYCVPVHLYGHSLDLERMRRMDCVIVEDCAQSVGATFKGMATGSAGALAATSFYPTKNLGAMGDAGAILGGDEGLAAKIRILRDYGQSAKYRHCEVGYNSRLDELQAALLGRVFLPKLEAWTARRREIAECYVSAIRNPLIRVVGKPAGSESCWHLFPVLVDDRAQFQRHLRDCGVLTGEHYPVAIPDQPVMSGCRMECLGDLVNARAWCASEVSLPVHPYLTDAEVGRVVEACESYRAEMQRPQE